MLSTPKEDTPDFQNPNGPRFTSMVAISVICMLILISTFTLYKSAQSRQVDLQGKMLNVEVNRVQRAIEVNLQKEAYFLVWLASSFEAEGVIDGKSWRVATQDVTRTFPFSRGCIG